MKKTFLALATIVGLFSQILPASAAFSIQYQSTINSVAMVLVVDSEGYYSWGSGFFISQDGAMITNAHVIMDYVTGLPATDISICTIENEYSEPNCQYFAEIWAYDEDLDLAVIAPAYEIDANGMIGEEYLQTSGFTVPYYDDLADTAPMLGDELMILGFPAASINTTITLTKGIVSGFESLDADYLWKIETDATINPGNSGGPAYDANERVVGVVTEVSTEGIGGNYGYIISNDIIYLWFQELVTQGVLNEEFVNTLFSNDYVDSNTDVDLSDIQSDPSTNTEPQVFDDVSRSHPNTSAINYLYSIGIINGYNDGTFKPDGEINRAELIKMVVEMIIGQPDSNTYKNCFPDVKTDWYAPYVCYAKEQGWVQGYPDGTFKPSTQTNRAEAIKIIVNSYYGGESNLPPLDRWHSYNFKMPSDVTAVDWFYNFVRFSSATALLDLQHTTAYTGTDYKYFPGGNMTRKEVAEMIYRLLSGYGEYGEKEAYTSALLESTCLTLELGAEDPTLESQIEEIFTIYGFNVADDAWMESATTKYLDDPEVNEAIANLTCN